MVDAAPTDPFGLVGTILDGQYRVDAVVGEGGFGVVYRGYHLTFEQPIAIKALKIPELDPATRDSVLFKFREEAKLLYVLSHASLSIVRSIGFGALNTPRGGWAPFVVLEWLEGKSLATDLSERAAARAGGRSLAEAMALLEPAARGLIAAHHQRVAHRDVKPGNFFLTHTGDVPPKPTMKVLDFGIAKILVDEEATRATGFVSFTPFYAAPEQLDTRLGKTGLHTDVYSFALVMVEVLSGNPPFDGREVIQIVQEATDPSRRPTPRARGAAVPDGVEAVFQRALAVDPRARHADLEQMWDALTKAVAAASPTGTVAIPSVARAHQHVPTQPMPQSAVVPSKARNPTQPMPASAARPSRPLQPSLATPPPIAVPIATPPRAHAPSTPGLIPPAGPPPGAAPWTPVQPPAQPAPQPWAYAPRPLPPAPSAGVHWAVWLGIGLGLLFFALACVTLLLH